jgi:hypothetical protein
LSNMVPLWQMIDICSPVVFIPTMWLKKTFHSVFSFVVFVLFCIYTADNLFPRPIVNLVGGLFCIPSDSKVSLEEQIWPTQCIPRTQK